MARPGTAHPAPVHVDHLARHLGVHPRTVLRAIERGEIAASRLGRQWLIPASEVARLSGVREAA